MPQGFAALTKKQLIKVSSKGGKAAHEKGTAHEWTSEEAKEAVQKREAKGKNKKRKKVKK